jgi:hypothetical protein
MPTPPNEHHGRHLHLVADPQALEPAGLQVAPISPA